MEEKTMKRNYLEKDSSILELMEKNKKRHDKVGDLCSDLLTDESFIGSGNKEKYIIDLGIDLPHTQDSIQCFFKEYDGRELNFHIMRYSVN